MTRLVLLEALRIYNLERGMDPAEAEREAQQSRARVQELCKGSISADIHLNDFYFVALKEAGEFYVEAEHLEAALQNLRALRRVDDENA